MVSILIHGGLSILFLPGELLSVIGMKLIERFEQTIKTPAKVFDAVKNEGFGEAALYYAVFFVAATTIAALEVFALKGTPVMSVVIAPIAAAVMAGFAIAFSSIGAFLLHISSKILGGKGKFMDLWKALMYVATPYLISVAVAPLPVIGSLFGLVAGIWGLVLEVIALKRVESFGTGKAILAIILASVIVIVVVVALIAAIGLSVIGTLMSMGSMMPVNVTA